MFTSLKKRSLGVESKRISAFQNRKNWKSKSDWNRKDTDRSEMDRAGNVCHFSGVSQKLGCLHSYVTYINLILFMRRDYENQDGCEKGLCGLFPGKKERGEENSQKGLHGVQGSSVSGEAHAFHQGKKLLGHFPYQGISGPSVTWSLPPWLNVQFLGPSLGQLFWPMLC